MVLHHWQKGQVSKTSLVFLHGYCEDLRMWDGVLEKGFEDYHVVCLDLPGFGASAPLARASIADIGQAVLDQLDLLAVDRFVLFGHSMGGYVALAMAEQAPERLLGLGLIHSHPFADSEAGKAARQKSIEFVKTHGTSLYVKQVISSLFPEGSSGSNGFQIDQLIFRANQYPKQGILQALQAMKDRPDRSEALEYLKIPVLCIIGALDTMIPLNKFLEQCDYPAICQVSLLPGVGHMGPFEAPRAVRKEILHYLDNYSILNTE